jgi:hypothetical protein
MFQRSVFASGMSRHGIGDFDIVVTSLMHGLWSRKLCWNDGGCFPPAVNNNNNVRSVISTVTNIRNVILKKKDSLHVVEEHAASIFRVETPVPPNEALRCHYLAYSVK